jgi:CBS-domain-containing membrane protein
MKSLRFIPQEKWTSHPVTEITDRSARTVCPYHSMEVVEHELTHGAHDYIPVVDPATDHLLGILSGSDVLRARNHARELVTSERSGAAVAETFGFANTKEK